MPDLSESFRYRVGLILVAALIALMFVPMIRGQVPLHDDLTSYFLPTRSFLAACLASGEDPTWCPDLFGGFFLGGEGGGMAHPLIRALYATLPLNLAFNLDVLWCYPAMLVGFIVLLGRWGVPRDASLFGGVLFAFSGYNLLHYIHVNVMAVLAHTPWLLVAIDVTLRASNPRRRSLARLGVSLLTTSQVLMAHVQFVWISLLGELLYTVILASQVSGAGRRLPGLAVSKALGILGGSIQLLPLWDVFTGSQRERPSPNFVAMGSLSPANLLQWVAPYLTTSRVVAPRMKLDWGIMPPASLMSRLAVPRVHDLLWCGGAGAADLAPDPA